MEEDSGVRSAKFQGKEVTPTYYIPSKCHSSVNAKGTHSQICKNSRNVACMHEPFLNMQALPDKELNQHNTTPKYKCGGKNPDGKHEIHLNIKAKLTNGEVMEQNGMEQNGYDLYKEIILTSEN